MKVRVSSRYPSVVGTFPLRIVIFLGCKVWVRTRARASHLVAEKCDDNTTGYPASPWQLQLSGQLPVGSSALTHLVGVVKGCNSWATDFPAHVQLVQLACYRDSSMVPSHGYHQSWFSAVVNNDEISNDNSNDGLRYLNSKLVTVIITIIISLLATSYKSDKLLNDLLL